MAANQEMRDRLRAATEVWRCRDGRSLRLIDMSTAHLINAAAMIARNQLRRKHGIFDPEDNPGIKDSELRHFFDLIMSELNLRLERKKATR